jgi:uncharacterized membrane protein
MVGDGPYTVLILIISAGVCHAMLLASSCANQKANVTTAGWFPSRLSARNKNGRP